MNGPERHGLPIDLEQLESAFENGLPDLSYYLDTVTGAIAMVSDETRGELDEIYAELDSANDLDDAAVAEAIRQRNVPDWQREALEEADRVERGFGTRYIAVPRDETHDAYRDMEDFVASVADERLHERLADAIVGGGAFGRFKRVLSEHDEERESWFAFRDARLRDRVVAWLEEEGIEPVGR